MFSDVVYYHCSGFQIFRPLNGSHFLVLSLYPHSVQNQAWFWLHFSDHGKPKQTDVIFSRFVSLSLVNHGRLPRKNWPIAGFSPLLSWAITSFGNKFCLKMRSRLIKALNNRFCVKLMQLEIGLLSKIFPFLCVIAHVVFWYWKELSQVSLRVSRFQTSFSSGIMHNHTVYSTGCHDKCLTQVMVHRTEWKRNTFCYFPRISSIR